MTPLLSRKIYDSWGKGRKIETYNLVVFNGRFLDFQKHIRMCTTNLQKKYQQPRREDFSFHVNINIKKFITEFVGIMLKSDKKLNLNITIADNILDQKSNSASSVACGAFVGEICRKLSYNEQITKQIRVLGCLLYVQYRRCKKE